MLNILASLFGKNSNSNNHHQEEKKQKVRANLLRLPEAEITRETLKGLPVLNPAEFASHGEGSWFRKPNDSVPDVIILAEVVGQGDRRSIKLYRARIVAEKPKAQAAK